MATAKGKSSPSKKSKVEPSNTKSAAQAYSLSITRELVRAYQAFAAYSERHIREMGLTPAQFDVIATLGNTNGMSMKDVAERTLVTKGTLTGIIDRLEDKGFVRREVPQDNRRSFTLVLTPAGEEIFEKTFPAHIAYIQKRFDQMDRADLEHLRVLLERLREQF